MTRNLGLAILAGMIFYSINSWAGRQTWARLRPRAMTVEDAYKVLGLSPGASREDVHTAYRSQMMRVHPDYGGSTYLAAQVNEAKEILLRALKV